MLISLNEILDLEDRELFGEVFDAYDKIYVQNSDDYEVWKHFYFFLWIAIEDAPSSFHQRIDLRSLLQRMFDEGKEKFSELADFNFVAGYTVSIFPYEYGDYETLENEAGKMLFKATKLDSKNVLYKMVYLGHDARGLEKEYEAAKMEAQKMINIFSGKGMLNGYFRDVLFSRGKGK